MIVSQVLLAETIIFPAQIPDQFSPFCSAQGVKYKLDKLFYIAHGSMFKTLAAKHDSSTRKEANKLKVGTDHILKYVGAKGIKEIKVFKLKDLKTHSSYEAGVDLKPNTCTITKVGVELIRRLNAFKCEYCAKEGGYFEVHQAIL